MLAAIVGLGLLAVPIVIVAFGLSVAMICIGADNLHRCPIEPMIPVYLTGNFSIIQAVTDACEEPKFLQ